MVALASVELVTQVYEADALNARPTTQINNNMLQILPRRKALWNKLTFGKCSS